MARSGRSLRLAIHCRRPQALENGLRAQVMNDPDWQAAKPQLTSMK
jgi:hypothetical protein